MLIRHKHVANWTGTLLAMALLMTGCGAPPTATISDPQVYTPLHLRVIAMEVGPDVPSVEASLNRYFLSPTTRPANRLDEVLNNYQTVSAYMQAIKAQLVATVLVSGSGGKSSGQGAADASPNNGGATGQEADNQSPKLGDLLKDLAGAERAYENGCDLVDRAVDLYTAYIMQHVRRAPDSRVVPAHALYERLTGNRIEETAPNGDPYPTIRSLQDARMLLLCFQTHIHPGTRANYMTGIRLRITGTDPAVPQPEGMWKSSAGPDLVRVVRVFPSRCYDVDSTGFREDLEQALALAAKAKFGSADVSVDRKVSLDAHERRVFLSRVGKIGSFADASTHTFGWNFYPSNVQVSHTNLFEQAFGWIVGNPKAYRLQSYLDAGAKDCAVVILVPRNLKSITCEMTNIAAEVDPDHRSSKEIAVGGPRVIKVPLPDWSDYEVVEAGPTRPGLRLPLDVLTGWTEPRDRRPSSGTADANR